MACKKGLIAGKNCMVVIFSGGCKVPPRGNMGAWVCKEWIEEDGV